MVLRTSPFPNFIAAGLHALGWALIMPCFWLLDRLIALCMSTTQERHQRIGQACYTHSLEVFFGFITFFPLFLISTPLALLGFLLWAPLQLCRRPFSYHRETPALPEDEMDRGFEQMGTASFGFATANLCLLPDSLARFNNLSHTQNRAIAIGQRITQGVNRPHIRILVNSPSSCAVNAVGANNRVHPADQDCPSGSSPRQNQPLISQESDGSDDGQRPGPSNASDSISNSSDRAGSTASNEEGDAPAVQPTESNSNQNSNQHVAEGGRRTLAADGIRQPGDIPWDVSVLFPAKLDILCLEEVFDKRAAQKLTNILKPVFGHILYDVGVYACQPPCRCSTFKFFNSGMLLASRFPVLEAKYFCFPNSRGEDALAAKGLLSVKVLIGKNRRQRNVVGYFNCTHLHAPEGEGAIRSVQLNMVYQWITDFQVATSRRDEVIAFDVLCGDFNFDNSSPDDRQEQNHRLFNDYKDPCRAGPGKEKPWVIGTLLEQHSLYDANVNSPENLQRTLEGEELRKQYLSPPVPQNGRHLVYPKSGEPWVGRRLDYILYRESSIADYCRTEVEEVTFITQLAGLTDHIPVGLRLTVFMDPGPDSDDDDYDDRPW